MQISDWSVLLLALKLASYLAILALAGTLVIRVISSYEVDETNLTYFNRYLKRWQIICVAIGFIAAILQIPIEAGAMAESGLSGMIDPFMLEIVWQSVIGEQALFRVLVFIVVMIAVCTWQPVSKTINYINFAFMLLMLILLTYSFTFTGHSSDKSILIKGILTLHLVAIASWAGLLWPLYKSCKLLPITEVKTVMGYFGQLAIAIVFVLLTSGMLLILQYLNSFNEILTTNYGQLILLKLLFVSAMLLLGAWHKFFLVPKLKRQHHVDVLKRSISVEILVACFVLITTSVFTTLVGPTY